MIRFRGHYDGKVIVPDEPIDLPENTNVTLVVEDATGPRADVGDGTAWQRIAALADQMPEHLPRDLADQHDHYLHGRPKR